MEVGVGMGTGMGMGFLFRIHTWLAMGEAVRKVTSLVMRKMGRKRKRKKKRRRRRMRRRKVKMRTTTGRGKRVVVRCYHLAMPLAPCPAWANLSHRVTHSSLT